MKVFEMTIADVVINPENRIRENLGDLGPLKERIQANAALPPITVNGADHELVTGERTLRAYCDLGRDTVAARLIDAPTRKAKLEAQLAENINRKAYTPYEIDKARRWLEESEAPAAAARRGTRTDLGENFPQVGSDFGRTRDRIALRLGVSGRQVDKIKSVYEAAEEDPETYGEVATQLTEDGNVEKATKRLKQKRLQKERREFAAEAPETEIVDGGIIVEGRFQDRENVIPDEGVDLFLIDPPYAYDQVGIYGEIAELASRKLRPGGLFLSYASSAFLPDVIDAVGEYLNYTWVFCLSHTGITGIYRPLKFRCEWKPILLYQKLPAEIWWDPVPDVIQGTKEKAHDEWQQGVSEAEELISRFTFAGNLVVDCVCGTGTTLVAAKKLGRRFIGLDSNQFIPEAVQIARRRISETAGIIAS